MLYWLYGLSDVFSPLRIFKYITFRAVLAAGIAFIISLVIGPWLIEKLRKINFGEQKTDDRVSGLEQARRAKVGTPTMGGLMILFSAVTATVLSAEPGNFFILCALTTFCFLGAVGFIDDYLKIKRKEGKGGLSSRTKMLAQVIWTLVLMFALCTNGQTHVRVYQLMVPFIKYPVISAMGFFGTLVFLFLVLVGSSNAVNLTDGLDGLAIGCTNSAAAAYLAMAYVAGHFAFAEYLQVPFVKGAGELAVFCGALLGSGLGFLWFNCHPAKVFMGDTGSLAIGGGIAAVAILIKQELVLIIVGGVFVMEAASVLIQTVWFKITKKMYGKGRRVFRCSPLHHHFEFIERDRATAEGRSVGAAENMITIRFWILSIIFALIGVATLKIR
ncbi:MAG: phospho-N-acetylmuramoyl-pentapeptide-transferase [Pontiellaceae bacterium]|jgi:phospho-N-acetylmuramoyl-pentapeptide-transferase|nr:phospho-N-acetylmuramoyl-pentapeptide-transferase [Pontiellaceae bacterium]